MAVGGCPHNSASCHSAKDRFGSKQVLERAAQIYVDSAHSLGNFTGRPTSEMRDGETPVRRR